MRKAFLASCALAFVASFAVADEVKKKDGTVVEGQVVEDAEDHVTIRNKLGDIRIARKDIASVKKPKGLDADLDKLKRATAEKLEALAKQADKQGRAEAARALRAEAEAVSAWALPDEVVAAKGDVDWTEIARASQKIERDEKLNGFQRDKAVEDLAERIAGKTTRVKMRVIEVTPYKDTWMSVTGVVGGEKPTFFFSDDDEKKKVEKLKKDDEITIEGTIILKPHFLPGIDNPHLR